MLGAGGHARVLQEIMLLTGGEIIGFIAPSADSQLPGVPWLGADSALATLDPAEVQLVNGVGSVSTPLLRRDVYRSGVSAGFTFATVVDPSATVRPSANIGEGVQILAGAIVNSDAVVGTDSIVNSGAIVEHGVQLGAHTHVSPGASLAGGVSVGDCTHVGIGLTIIQGLSIGSHCTVGAGSVVTRDVPDGALVVGVPAVERNRS